MAEGSSDLWSLSVQKLDDELTCAVCQSHFKEPKVLPCLHYYCKKCVAALIGRAEGKPFSCPECRRDVQAINDDPESFPTAFFVNRMEEVYSVMKKAEPKEEVICETCSLKPSVAFCQHCREYICEQCEDAHKKMRQFSDHVVESIDSLRTSMTSNEAGALPVVAQELKCSKHKDEPLKLYCRTCYKLVCRDCIVIDHREHQYAFVVDVAPKYKSAIKEKVVSLQNVAHSLKSALASLTESKKNLSDHGSATAKAIDDAHNKIASKLQQKSKELKEEADKKITTSTEAIHTQQKNAQLAVGEVESLLEFLRRNLEKATDQELLSLQKHMSDQADRIAQLYADPAAMYPIPRLPQLEVKCSEDVSQVLRNDFTVHDKAATQTVQWKGTLERLTSQLVKDKAELEAAWKESDKQKDTAIAKLTSEKENLEKEVAELKQIQGAVQSLTSQLESEKQQRSDSEATWKESIKQKDAEISALTSEKESLEKEVEELKQTQGTVESLTSQLQRERSNSEATLKESMKKKDEEIANIKSEKEVLEKELVQMKKRPQSELSEVWKKFNRTHES